MQEKRGHGPAPNILELGKRRLGLMESVNKIHFTDCWED